MAGKNKTKKKTNKKIGKEKEKESFMVTVQKQFTVISFCFPLQKHDFAAEALMTHDWTSPPLLPR